MALTSRSYEFSLKPRRKAELKRHSTINGFLDKTMCISPHPKSHISCDVHMADDIACLGTESKGRTIIQGVIRVHIIEEVILEELNVEVLGNSCIKSSPKFFEQFNSKDSLGNTHQFLHLIQSIVTADQPMRFSARQHYLPFEFVINEELPTSYETSSAKIYYSLNVSIKSSRFAPTTIYHPFTVLRCYLNTHEIHNPLPYDEIIHVEHRLMFKLQIPTVIFPNERYASLRLEIQKLLPRSCLPKSISFSITQSTSLLTNLNDPSQVINRTKSYMLRNILLASRNDQEIIRLDALLWIFKGLKLNFSTDTFLIRVKHWLKIEFHFPIFKNRSITLILPIQLQAYPKDCLEKGDPPTYIPPPRYSLS